MDGALADYTEAIRLEPDDSDAYYNRGKARDANGDSAGAVRDYQKYLDLGGGIRDGDQAQVDLRFASLRRNSRRADRSEHVELGRGYNRCRPQSEILALRNETRTLLTTTFLTLGTATR